MKRSNRSRRILKVFFTRMCKLKFEKLKNRIKNHNEGNLEMYHVGDHYSLLELMRFDADIIINDFDLEEIYVKQQDYFIKSNPFI